MIRFDNLYKYKSRVLGLPTLQANPSSGQAKGPDFTDTVDSSSTPLARNPPLLSLRLSLREFDSKRRRRDEGHGDDRRRADSFPRRRPRRIRKLARPVLPPPQSICSRLAGFAEFGDESATRAGNDLEFWKG